jgi:hypothetical protein
MAEISQDLGCGFASLRAQQATAFSGLKAAILCVVYAIFFTHNKSNPVDFTYELNEIK